MKKLYLSFLILPFFLLLHIEKESECPMRDEDLIKRIRQGDEIAAEELIHRYYPSIFRYCRWRCDSRETAEDLTQETFLRLFKALPDYREKGKFKAYIFLIAHRLCINEGKKTPLYPLENEEQLANPHDDIHQMEDRDEIRRLLEELPPEQREAIILRFGERLSFQNIAKATGCTMRTAQGRVKCA